MTNTFYVALFALLFLLFIVVGYYALTLFNETDLLGARLRRVSQMLQKAELDTGVPYFTSLGNYLDVENPTMFLIAKRRAVFQPIEEEEEQEEQEQEQEEQEQEEQEQEQEEQEQEEQEQEENTETEHTSDEERSEEAVSDISHISHISQASNRSQVVPSPTREVEYTPIFQLTKQD